MKWNEVIQNYAQLWALVLVGLNLQIILPELAPSFNMVHPVFYNRKPGNSY
jgi:hypothetical protein